MFEHHTENYCYSSSGIHHPSSTVRKRVFYLFFRFVQSLRIDIDIQHVPPILQAIQDLLTFDVEFPEDFDPSEFPGRSDQEILANFLKEPTMFDAQLYMFEAAGALVSTLWSLPEYQPDALRSVAGPLLSRLSTCLQAPTVAAGGRLGEEELKNVLAVHHCIQALGSIPKGFPEYPSPVPPDYIPPPIAEFRQMADAILVSLDFMGQFRIVREAVSTILCALHTLLMPRLFAGSLCVWAHHICSGSIYYRVHSSVDELSRRSFRGL